MSRKRIYFVTGTDTGVGKTIVTVMLTRFLREHGERIMTVKPYCSGGRDDALQIRVALGGAHSLNEINPWHFREPLAPLIAARRQGVKLLRTDCLRFLNDSLQDNYILIVEGAGGLLSPLGDGFDARDLIAEIRATPIVVCPNKLGAINQVRLVHEALPKKYASIARIALVEPARKTILSKTNWEALAETIGVKKFTGIPHAARTDMLLHTPLSARWRAACENLLRPPQNR